jgi:predicted GIY-YIG superfamily endonuclease
MKQQLQEIKETGNDRYEVYSLRDPMTRKVFYIGIAKDPYKRFMQHLYMDGSNPEKDGIIASMKEKGLTPIMQVECKCYDKSQAEANEAEFIEYYRAHGHKLCNQMLPLNKYADAGRRIGEYERDIKKQYTDRSRLRTFFDRLRVLLIINPSKRRIAILQMEEEIMLFQNMKESEA